MTAYTDEEMKPCDTCAVKPGEVNHPQGMIFVGWGFGWVPCPACQGTGAASRKPIHGK